MEKGIAACERDVRLDRGVSDRNRNLNLVAELSGSMGHCRACCQRLQWMVMGMSFLLAFLVLWDFSEQRFTVDELADETLVREMLPELKALLRELEGEGSDVNSSRKLTLSSSMSLSGKVPRQYPGWTLSTLRAWTNLRAGNSVLENGSAVDVRAQYSEPQFIRRAPDPHSFNKSVGAFRRWQDKNMHHRNTSSGRKEARRRRRLQTKAGRATRPRTSWLLAKILASAFLLMSVVSCMIPGGMRGHAPRTNAHIGDAGPPFIGTATLKVPPAWSVERSEHYSLRAWVSDLILWSTATDLEAHRLGPIAALQVNGSARELVRELTPDQLANGVQDPQNGQHITGLMLLVRTLIQRYAPLDNEISTKAVSEFLQFARMPGESVDSVLVRFDVLRNRAAQRGGLGLNHTGLSWILFRALNLPPELMDRALSPFNGQLPQNEAQLVELMSRIRRQGHLYEGKFRPTGQQGATGDTGAYFTDGPHVNSQGSAEPQQQPWVPSAPASSAFTSAAVPPSADYHAQGFAGEAWSAWDAPQCAPDVRCSACGVYFGDDDLSSATDTDDNEPDEGAHVYAQVEVDGQWRSDDEAIGEKLYLEYIVAKRRWRRFSNKPPRRYRKFPNRFRAQGKGSRNPYSSSFASFLPANAFAGGKGAGKGAGKSGKASNKGKTNPRGKDGRPLKCSKCGSTEHLWRRCPQVVQNQSAPTGGASHFVNAGPQPALTLHTIRAHDAHETSVDEGLESVVADRLLPSVSFAGFTSARSDVSVRTGFEAEMEALSQVSSGSARNKRKKDIERDIDSPKCDPPAWEPGLPSSVRPDDSASQVGSVEALIPGVGAPRFPPPAHEPELSPALQLPHAATSDSPFSGSNSQDRIAQAKAKSAAARRQATLQLSNLLFPWWETESLDNVLTNACSGMYHLRTRIAGKVGLLVDPGAHDNLIGGNTAQLLEKQCGAKATMSALTSTLNVAGVGKEGQSTDQSLSVDLAACDEVTGGYVRCSFRAPVIENSDLPPLLGLKSLRRMNAVVDCGQQLLVLPGPGSLKHEYPPGTVALKLEMSPSGHLILPVSSSQKVVGQSGQVLDFMHQRAQADPNAATSSTSKPYVATSLVPNSFAMSRESPSVHQ